MSFVSLTTGQIAGGEATKQELFQTIKDNEDSHESRLLVLETTVVGVQPILFEINGDYYRKTTPQTGALYYLVPYNMTLTGAKIYLSAAGTAGTLSCDLQYKRGGAAFTSIFSTLPSIAYTVGDNAVSSNAVISTNALLTDDRLRFDIYTTQTTTTATLPGNFTLILSYTKT